MRAPTYASGLIWPMQRPRVITGGYGESRPGRFHAGLDLSTGGRTGESVLAPADVHVERVRTASAGYGRSLYLRTADGRLIVFGHLDAFAPPLAAHVDSAQRSSGDYDVDLWPATGRFRFAAGERVAWSGQSGAGPPHLHVEVRHGDFALEPLLWGYAVPDTIAPRLESLVLEPLDEMSWVSRGAEPRLVKLSAREDTLVVEGRARLTLIASDATALSKALPVHAQGARFDGQWVECRRDSLSWAGEMEDMAWLVDRGRVRNTDGVILDAPHGWRPRFLLASRPAREAVELVKVYPGATPKLLELFARDAAGNESVRRLWLRGPTAAERGVREDRSPAAKPGAKKSKSRPAPGVNWSFANLPVQRVRVRVTGAPAGSRDVRFARVRARGLPEDSARATWDGAGWTAVMFFSGTPDADGLRIEGTGADGRAWSQQKALALWPSGSSLVGRLEGGVTFSIPPGATYEDGVVLARMTPLADLPPGATGLGPALELSPVTPPLRDAARITLVLPPDVPRDRVGLLRRDDERDGWEWSEGDWDSTARTLRLDTRRLGQFALARDETPPEITQRAPARRPSAGAYSTWSLTARVTDRASGVSGRASGFTVDGVRVPTEWDAEASLLRWRPLTPPAAGKHEYRVEAVDRAGNRTVRSGTFVIASP